MLDRMVHYQRMLGLPGLLRAVRGKAAGNPELFLLSPPAARFPLHLRVPSTDVDAYEQIFVNEEYRFAVRRPPATIVDAGANVGLASVYWANRYPDARIVAVEPEADNFELLARNVAPYPRVVPVRAALWHENRDIDLVDPELGQWGFMTQARDDEDYYGEIVHGVRGLTIDTLMAEQGLAHIDILKLDVEGAEREIFADPAAWIGKVDALIVELHERLKPGCCRSFYNGSNGFDEEWRQGENIYLARHRGCLARPTH